MISSAFCAPVARDALRRWLGGNSGRLLPQAIFCASDDIAIGCIETLAQLGLRVPDDLSVAGFDDTLVARLAVPQLTTVRQPLRAMGARAVELLLASIDRAGRPAKAGAKPVIFPVDLVTRASVGPPPVVDRLVPVMR